MSRSQLSHRVSALAFAGALALTVAVLANPVPSRAMPAGEMVTVGMSDAGTYEPAMITVPVGTVVTWVNQGFEPHTVTSIEGVFDSGADEPTWIGHGGSFAFTFAAPGTYAYMCLPHADIGMAGTVVVQ